MTYTDIDGDKTVPASITRPYSIQTAVDEGMRDWLVAEANRQSRTVSGLVYLILQNAKKEA